MHARDDSTHVYLPLTMLSLRLRVRRDDRDTWDTWDGRTRVSLQGRDNRIARRQEG